MNQGEIRWYKFKEPNKQRPVLILTRSDLIPLLNAVSVAEISTTIRDNDSEVWLDESDGMPERRAANLANIQTVPKSKMGASIAQLSNERLGELRSAIEFVFNLERL
jgi:mRNA interferase MazF